MLKLKTNNLPIKASAKAKLIAGDQLTEDEAPEYNRSLIK